MNLETLKYIKENPKRLFSMLGSKGLLNWIPDELYIKIKYKFSMGYWPDLKNPKTFNEKLQWLKLHDRNPLYTTLVDKYAVRQYIADKIGEEYLIPLVGGPWKNAEEIDFDALPERFVLKCNHDSGGVIVCKDKSKLDVEAAKRKLNKRIGVNYYYANREWPYKNVEPCIIAEQYMEDESGELKDYKVFCFDGKAEMMFIASDRNELDCETKFDFFDMNFRHLPFVNGHPNASILPECPTGLQEMKLLAESLSQGLPHTRVDFYSVAGRVYFGEVTLYHWSGMMPYDPPAWDKQIGDWLKLPGDENGQGCCSEKER